MVWGLGVLGSPGIMEKKMETIGIIGVILGYIGKENGNDYKIRGCWVLNTQ